MINQTILDQIRKNEAAFDLIFSEEYRFSEHLYKQSDAKLPDMYHHNAFITDGIPTEEELTAAERLQKENGQKFFLIKSKEPLPSVLIRQFGLEEDITDTMLLQEHYFEKWKCNPSVIVIDRKDSDIENDILSTELKNYGSAYGVDFVKRKMRRYLEMSEKYDGFHYFGAYIDDIIAGACYAFCTENVICIDGLVVNKEFRKQYVATTLLSHIVKTLGDKIFLHADANDTPKHIYERMGFHTIESMYEYLKI